MKLKMAAASLAVAALTVGPIASAAPGNGNGNKPASPPGHSVSEVAKSGAGPVGVITVLSGLGPYNTGRLNALQRVTANHPESNPAATTSTGG